MIAFLAGLLLGAVVFGPIGWLISCVAAFRAGVRVGEGAGFDNGRRYAAAQFDRDAPALHQFLVNTRATNRARAADSSFVAIDRQAPAPRVL